MTASLAAAYRSGSQRARVVTEAWGAENFYCPNCVSPRLAQLDNNTHASDYQCPRCGFWYQLKGQKTRLGDTITDGAYAAMMRALREDRAPNYFFLHYEILNAPLPGGAAERGEACAKSLSAGSGDPAYNATNSAYVGRVPSRGGTGASWVVRNLLLVPHFAFPPSAIIKRKPLAATARRAGWVGCNFDLRRIPAAARIALVLTPNGRSRGDRENSIPALGQPQSHPVHPSGTTGSPSPWGDLCREGSGARNVAGGAGPQGRASGSERVTVGGEGGLAQTVITPPEVVRAQFQRVKPFAEIGVTERGWTLEVWSLVQRLTAAARAPQVPNLSEPAAPSGRPPGTFTNADLYAHERELEQLHPDNRHVRDKIRQQLQVLRDRGFLTSPERGVWQLV